MEGAVGSERTRLKETMRHLRTAQDSRATCGICEFFQVHEIDMRLLHKHHGEEPILNFERERVAVLQSEVSLSLSCRERFVEGSGQGCDPPIVRSQKNPAWSVTRIRSLTTRSDEQEGLSDAGGSPRKALLRPNGVPSGVKMNDRILAISQ